MSRTFLIVGSGPAAVAAAMACLEHDDVHVTVLDVGGRLERVNDEARARLAVAQPSDWQPEDISTISHLPVASSVEGVPEKRAFGSDFPFADFGQLQGVATSPSVNPSLVSGAYGGFSNVWGAQVMPFSAPTFRDWPIDDHEMYRHYGSILRAIPYAAEEDDLAGVFPLIGRGTALPGLSDRSEAVLANYSKHRGWLNRRGVSLGRARLAMQTSECVRAGLCLSGCPYSLVYSASQTMDTLRQREQVSYHGGLLAIRVEESSSGATVIARDMRTERLERFTADRVFLACGAIGTTRLVLGSLKLFDRTVTVFESAQFMLPFCSVAPVPDPRCVDDFTLNQFNMVVDVGANEYDLSQLHFYTYNAAFIDALPSVLQRERASAIRKQLLRRLSVAFGYLPSWASPQFHLRADAPKDAASLPALSVTSGPARFGQNPMLRSVLRRVSAAARRLDLWPVLPMLVLPARGKSYHWGGTFAHTHRPESRFSSDVLGRVAPWQRVHLVDASVFPNVAATTFTLTIMANAHRIVETALNELI